MKRLLAIVAVLVTASLLWVFAQAPTGVQPLAALFPSGPLLYLEARDFQAQLRDWSGSREKQLWLSSINYSVFSRSTLFLKLQTAQTEFAAAAGVPPDLALLDNVAGRESALAIYDIGNLQFLYITRMPQARVAESAIWKVRGTYQPRQSAGLDYYLKYDKASNRTAVFAAAKEYLLLATREDVLAGALALLAGQTLPAVTAEPWFGRGVQAAQAPGDLRLVLNMPRLLQSPYMRSYWLQRNASELRQYDAAISDLTREAGSLRENRMLLRTAEETLAWDENAVAQISRLIPADAGLYRASASPSAQQAFDTIRDKVLEPLPGAGPDSRRAPDAVSLDSTAGSEGDLETHIDERPPTAGSEAIPDALKKLLEAAKLDALLEIGSTRVLPDGVFAGIDWAVVLTRGTPWDAAATRTALAAAGARFDGPSPAAMAVRGSVLILANRAEFADVVAGGLSNTAALSAARYAAGYRHGRELPNFEKLTRLIDNPLKTQEPMFFSQNLASLGRSLLGRLDMATLTVHDSGATVSQKLVYRLQP